MPSAYETRDTPTQETLDVPSGMSLLLITYVPQVTSIGLGYVPMIGDTLDISYTPLRQLEYILTQENLVKMVKAQNKFKQQLSIQAKKINPFMDRIVVESIKIYENLHARMNDMEEHVNDKL